MKALIQFWVFLNLTFYMCHGLWASEAMGPLPVEAFAHLPDVKQIKLSPSGRYIASIVRIHGEGKSGSVITWLDVETGDKEPIIWTDNSEYLFNWLRWANDDQILVSLRFPDRRYGIQTLETRLLVYSRKTKKFKNLLKKRYIEGNFLPQFQDNIVDILPDDPKHILLSIDTRRPGRPTVFKINLDTGYRARVQGRKKHDSRWITDQQHRVRASVTYDDGHYEVLVKDLNNKRWSPLWDFDDFSENQVSPIGFDSDPNVLYVRAYYQGRLAIYKVNLLDETLKKELVYSNKNYDVDGGLIYSSLTGKVIGIDDNNKEGHIFWDESYQALQNGISKGLPERNNSIIGFSRDERRYLVFSSSDVDAGTYYFGDRDKRLLMPIAERYSSLKSELMSEKQVISYQARDGLQIEGFLTLPKNRTSDQSLPAIIFPHGGPNSYDGLGFDYWTQFFANRGYAVLQMNFRGSAGYGFDFMKAGLKNWGLEMQNDVEDGTRWLIDQKIADPEKICIVGGSYGGYAALMATAYTPDLFQCAVSFAGVTDLVKLVKSHRWYQNYETVKEQIGSDFKELKQRSPVKLVDKMNAPILLVHGTEDRVVKIGQAKAMRRALKKAKKNFQYIEQEGGNHYLSNEQHRLEFFKAMDVFLKKHLN